MRIGIVGYGTGGQHFHAPFIQAAQGIELGGIVARSKEKVAAANADFPDVPVYDSLTSMIKAGNLDAVTITTPPHTRRELVLEAIDAGLHVVADKPFAPNAQVARELAEAAHNKGVVLSVFHNRRFDSDVVTLKKLIDDGRLGKVWRLHSRLDYDDPVTLEQGPNGGLLRDLGSHVVDQAIHLLSPVTDVYAQLHNIMLEEGLTNVSFALTLTHTSGAHSYISASKLNHIEAKEFRVYGDKGSYHSCASDVQAQAIFAGKRPVDDPQHWGYEDRAHWGTLNIDEGSELVPSEQGRYQDFYTGFANAVMHGAPLPVTPAQAIHVLDVLDAAQQSAQSNSVIHL